MPRIITAAQIGLTFQNLFGSLGDEQFVTGHHSAGATDKSDLHAQQLVRSYHAQHKAQGWGGIGYHFCITRKGTILGLRPTYLKGAHTGGWNTGNVGVLFHGTTGDKPTRAQARAYRWLLKHAHTSKLPRAHRTDLDLRKATRKGHREWSGHETNACPGTHFTLIKKGVR